MTKPKSKSRRKPTPSTGSAMIAVVQAGVAAYELVKPFFAKRRKAKVKKAKTKGVVK